ncbi:MAG: protein phosphatase 2C domain-containing protein [Acidobacteriota bacterium]
MSQAFGATDPGCVRSNNEDRFVVDPTAGFYLVADGMGGAQAGERASQIAAETLVEVVKEEGAEMNAARLASAFHLANQRVKDTASRDQSLHGMGTTLVAALERDGHVMISSVGDSRAYQLTNGQLTPITEDQTWVQDIGRRLGLTEENLRTHPMRHVLTMAIGVSQELKVNSYSVPASVGTVILLCSDGLHGVVAEKDIAHILAGPEPLDLRGKQLIEAARALGAPDNVTVVLLEPAR